MYSDPLAYFLTWTTYGTWLPGDERGWYANPGQWSPPDNLRKLWSQIRMTEDAIVLNHEQRQDIESTIRKHCEIHGWHLHAVNCRSNHVHVVVTANITPKLVMEQFKAWCTRNLKALARQSGDLEQAAREKWWTENGSKPYLFTHEELHGAITYTLDQQEGDRFKA